MAHYQIFIPRARADVDELDKLGLAGLHSDDAPQAMLVEDGPGQQPGAIFAWQLGALENPAAEPMFGYYPAKQEWTPQRGGAFYLGCEPARPVTPLCVARRKQLPSLNATLRDGQEWKVPITCQLPQVWGLDEAGEFATRIAPEYRDYCELSQRVYLAFFNAAKEAEERGQDMPLPAEVWEYCCRALALNYRLNEDVISWLGLIASDNFVQILMASIEIDLIREVEGCKKKMGSSTPAT